MNSGHWPLPKQVSEMFEWLDLVSINTPSGMLGAAFSELAKEEPALFVLAAASGGAGKLLRTYRGKDRKELQARLDLLLRFVEDAQAAHAGVIEDGSSRREKDQYESWMAHFVSVHPALAPSKKWRSTFRKLIQNAVKQDRLVEQATKLLDAKPGRVSFIQATKVVEKALLAADMRGLMEVLGRLSEEPLPGVSGKDLQRYRQVVEGRSATLARGEEEAKALTARVAAEFRNKHPELFAEDGSN